MNTPMAATAATLIMLKNGDGCPGEADVTRTGHLESESTKEAYANQHDRAAVIENRIANAELERDAARSAGLQERYLAAYVLIEALELQLAQLSERSRPRHNVSGR